MLVCFADISIFTDHLNLLFTFHTTVVKLCLDRHQILIVIRWALYLQAFSSKIEPVPGEPSILVEITTRCMRGDRGTDRFSGRVVRLCDAL